MLKHLKGHGDLRLKKPKHTKDSLNALPTGFTAIVWETGMKPLVTGIGFVDQAGYS